MFIRNSYWFDERVFVNSKNEDDARLYPCSDDCAYFIIVSDKARSMLILVEIVGFTEMMSYTTELKVMTKEGLEMVSSASVGALKLFLSGHEESWM